MTEENNPGPSIKKFWNTYVNALLKKIFRFFEDHPLVMVGVSVSIVVSSRLALTPLMGSENPFLLLRIAIFICSISGGFTYGLLSVVLSALLGKYFLLQPAYTLVPVNAGEVIRVGLFIFEGILLAFVGGLFGAHRKNLLVLIQDLIKAKKEAEIANDIKKAFLANMSHEIRTPLTAVLGFSDLLSESRLNAPVFEEYLKIIKRNGNQLLGIIEDLMDLSRVEAGQISLNIQPIQTNIYFSELLSTWKSKALEKNLQMTLNIDSNVTKSFLSDHRRLGQILDNVIGNAIKHTSSGSIDIHVSEPSEGLLTIKIKDSGIGISREQLSRLFFPFARADYRSGTKVAGTGLGLALSRNLARALGGDLVIESSLVNQGSVFSVSILAQKVELATQSSVKPEEENSSNYLSQVKVLLAEDSIDSQYLIKRTLEMRGASVDVVANGLQAVSRARTGGYDVILMDIQMPIMDGVEATKQLRQSGYRGPILALTAHTISETRPITIESGCNDLLSKPIDVNTLIKKVKKYSQVGIVF